MLLYKNGRLVKGVKYKKFRDVGETSSSIKIYNNQLADELMLINISNEEREIKNFFNTVVKKSAVKFRFVPLTTGGKNIKIRTYRETS